MTLLRTSDKDFRAKLRAFVGAGEAAPDIRAIVAGIIADVKKRGDRAVLDYTAKFDHAKLSLRQLRVPLAQLGFQRREFVAQRPIFQSPLHQLALRPKV